MGQQAEPDETAMVQRPAQKKLVLSVVGDTRVAVAASTALVPSSTDRLFLDPLPDPTADIPFPVVAEVTRLYRGMLPAARQGFARVRHPDLAMALASTALNRKLTLQELGDNIDVFFGIQRKGGKYINFNRKHGQLDFDGKKLLGYHFVSTAFRPMFRFEYGSTEATGVNGDQGKSKGPAYTVENGKEKYECTMGVEPFHPLLQDANENNPLSVGFLRGLQLVRDYAWDRMWGDSRDYLLDMRLNLQNMVDSGTLQSYPTSASEALAALSVIPAGQKDPTYNEHIKPDPNDVSAFSMRMDASVYRKPYAEQKWAGVAAEDVTVWGTGPGKRPFPSEMFDDNFKNGIDKQTKEKAYRLWNELPVWRWRHPSEIKAGQKYESPWVRLPAKEVALTSRDVLHALFRIKFYEMSAKNQCGFKYELAGFVWLNSADDLAALDYASLEPCNPLVANPCAGVWRPGRLVQAALKLKQAVASTAAVGDMASAAPAAVSASAASAASATMFAAP